MTGPVLARALSPVPFVYFWRKATLLLTALSCSACSGCTDDEAATRDAGAPPRGEPAAAEREPLAIVRSCEVPRALRDGGSIEQERDLVYAEMNGESLHLDLYRPTEGEAHPVVVLLHGGAWTHGDEDWMGHIARRLVSLGWATASVEYRLVGERAHAFPGPIADVRCAVRWLRSHADERRLDPDRIVAWGGSAGGHLAALLATAADVDELDGECPDRTTSPAVQGAIAHYAPHDLRPGTEWRRPAERVIAELLGAEREQRPDRASLASPASHVDADDPPLLLVHGTEDAVVDLSQSRGMRDRLRGAGVPTALVEVEGGEHGFRLLSRDSPEAAVCTSLSLLERVREGRDAEI